MKGRSIAVLLLLIATTSTLYAHDFFFRMDSYFVAPNSTSESVH